VACGVRRTAVTSTAIPMCIVIWLSPWGQRDCLKHGLTSTFVKRVLSVSLCQITGRSLPVHHSQAFSSGSSIFCSLLPSLMAHGLLDNAPTGSSESVVWVDMACLGPTSLMEGPFHHRFQLACISKHLLSFLSVQENIWKICPVNSSLCSCLDFNIYLPIQSNIWWMPMGKKIRHYEKQKAFFLFLFFPNRFTNMKKIREIQQIAQCLFKKRCVAQQSYRPSMI
jgi:hypothetical protein